MSGSRVKFATQLDQDLLAELRSQARAEGRQIQALVEEAVRNLMAERRCGKVRPHVMAAYHKSREHFASLYQKLAR